MTMLVKTPLAIANELLAGAITGVTVTAQGGQRVPARGYVVAYPDGLVVDILATIDRIGGELLGQTESFVSKNINSVVVSARHYFGAWIDPKTGVLYIDKVQVFSEKFPAMVAARSRKQIAVYDLAEKQDIVVSEYFANA